MWQTILSIFENTSCKVEESNNYKKRLFELSLPTQFLIIVMLPLRQLLILFRSENSIYFHFELMTNFRIESTYHLLNMVKLKIKVKLLHLFVLESTRAILLPCLIDYPSEFISFVELSDFNVV